MKTNLSWFLIFVFIFFGFIFFKDVSIVSSAANHVVISQVQVRSVSVSDEFVELYNPTSNDISLTSWRLTRKTSTGTESNLVASMSGTIKSHGYFLITPQTGYTGSVQTDLNYSIATAPLAADNTVLIYSDAGITLVDKVGMGGAIDVENTAAPNPASGSIQRKIDDTGGQGIDSDNNLNDFEALSISTPRNSLIVITPSPTNTPTPTSTPTPTDTPTPTPTEIPTPTPTNTPTPTPTLTSSPTPTPTGIVIPTNTPTPTPTATPSSGILPRFNMVCSMKNVEMVHLFGTIKFSIPMCTLVKVN